MSFHCKFLQFCSHLTSTQLGASSDWQERNMKLTQRKNVTWSKYNNYIQPLWITANNLLLYCQWTFPPLMTNEWILHFPIPGAFLPLMTSYDIWWHTMTSDPPLFLENSTVSCHPWLLNRYAFWVDLSTDNILIYLMIWHLSHLSYILYYINFSCPCLPWWSRFHWCFRCYRPHSSRGC